MPTSADQAFKALSSKLQDDADVLSVFLSGSRGKGFGTPTSDYDVVVIVQDDAVGRCRGRYPFHYDPYIDSIVVGFSALRTYATLESPDT